MENSVLRKHPLAACERCPWNETGAFVPSLVPKGELKVVVVGEAPGSYEAKTGIPFTGPSGELLDRTLEHHGIKRSEVALINVCSCRPAGPTEKPPKAAIAACSARLRADLGRALNAGNELPILAVGGTSAQTLLNDSRSISKLRIGPYRESQYGKVISTWHPAFCLRTPDAFPSFVRDTGKILENEKDNEWVPPHWVVIEDPNVALEAFARLRTMDKIVVDIEAASDKDIDDSHPEDYDLLCVGVAYAKGQAVVFGSRVFQDQKCIVAFSELLDVVKIIGHNLKFDLLGLSPLVGLKRAYADTMLKSYCVSPDTKILKTDLTWINAEDLTVGDELVACEENEIRLMKPSKVLETKRQIAKCYKITTEHGTVICSENHLWPVSRLGNKRRIWRTTKFLYDRVSSGQYNNTFTMSFMVHPWEIDYSYESGYIAGILDGEGYIGSNAVNRSCGFSQLPGPVYDQTIDYLKQKGFSLRQQKQTNTNTMVAHFTGRNEALRAVGTFRPQRLLRKSSLLWEGKRKLTPSKITSIEYLGEQEVIGVSTTTSTFVANGFISHNCLDERPRQHGLKLRSVEDLGAPKYDEEIAEYTKGKDGSFANIPKDLLYKYNAYDVCCTWDLNELFDIQMSDKQQALHSFLIEAVNELMHIELEGLHFDEQYNDRLGIEYTEKLEKSEAELQAHVGFPINPRSPLQILLFFANFGLILPTTKRDFLEKLREELDGDLQTFVDLLLENRNLTKTFGTYIKGLRRKVKHGKIYTTFSLHGTTSGRLASKNPNLQNIKREKAIRNQFTAAPGRILVQADYSQVEGRTICVLAQDEYLRGIFNDPTKDIFNDMCDNIWGPGAWDKENRVSIKSIFYGFAYGRKAKSIAHELNKPVAYATELMEEFKRLIPNVVAWQADIKHRVLSGEDLETPFGRRRTFHLITNDNKEDVLNEALSYKPQSIASDICLRAAVRLRPIIQREFDARIKLLVHDAIVTECDPLDKDAVIEVMVREMMRSGEEFSDYVPFRVDATSAFRLGEL